MLLLPLLQSDKHSLIWQKMTPFSTKCPCIIICSAQTHPLQCGKMITTLQDVAQVSGCALRRMESKHTPTILWFLTARKMFSCVKYGTFVASQHSRSLGLTTSIDDLVSESFIINFRSKKVIIWVWCPPRSIREAKGRRSHSTNNPAEIPGGGQFSENGRAYACYKVIKA